MKSLADRMESTIMSPPIEEVRELQHDLDVAVESDIKYQLLCADLQARLEKAEKDAERYKHILRNMTLKQNGMDGESKWFFSIGKRDEPYPKNSPYHKGKPFKSVTEAIDAAMKEPDK